MKKNLLSFLLISTICMPLEGRTGGELSDALNGFTPSENVEEWRTYMRGRFQARTEDREVRLRTARDEGASKEVCAFLEMKWKKAALSQAMFEEGKKPETPAGTYRAMERVFELRLTERHKLQALEHKAQKPLRRKIRILEDKVNKELYLIEVYLEQARLIDGTPFDTLEEELKELKSQKTAYKERKRSQSVVAAFLKHLNEQAGTLGKEIAALEGVREDSNHELWVAYGKAYAKQLDSIAAPSFNDSWEARFNKNMNRNRPGPRESDEIAARINRRSDLQSKRTALSEVQKSIEFAQAQLNSEDVPASLQSRISELKTAISKKREYQELERKIEDCKQRVDKLREEIEKDYKAFVPEAGNDIKKRLNEWYSEGEKEEYKTLKLRMDTYSLIKSWSYDNLSRALKDGSDLATYFEGRWRKWRNRVEDKDAANLWISSLINHYNELNPSSARNPILREATNPIVVETEFVRLIAYLNGYLWYDLEKTKEETPNAPSKDVLLQEVFEIAHRLWSAPEGQSFIKLFGFDAFVFKDFQACMLPNLGK